MAEKGTEKPTPKKREEARRKGQVARSPDVNSAVVLSAGLALLALEGPRLLHKLQGVLRDGLTQAADPSLASGDGVRKLAFWGMTAFADALVPLVLPLMAAGVLAGVLQVRPTFRLGLLKPSLGKINPGAGLKRMFSPASFVELLKAILKTAIVGGVAFAAVWPRIPEFGSLVGLPPGALLATASSLILAIGIRVALALALLAAADYAFQRWRIERSLRMTKDELKKEMRQTDLAPEVRQAIRRRQMSQARTRMLADVPTADVVVVNPTHFAVALRYDGTKAAPEVVAKGADLVAAAIRARAEESGVPLVHEPPLARALYREVQLGQQIPEAFFAAVAEVLAFVYRTAGSRRPAP